MGAMDKAIARVKEWYLAMLHVQPDFRLHTVDPDSETLTQLDDPEKFPSKLPDCKDFFAGLHPNTRGGNLQLKVLASSKRGMTNVAKETEFRHHALKDNFAVWPIQWHSTKLPNWLIFDPPNRLQETWRGTDQANWHRSLLLIHPNQQSQPIRLCRPSRSSCPDRGEGC
jgi:hypothetical protein